VVSAPFHPIQLYNSAQLLHIHAPAAQRTVG
jgi:hypothetical protein